MIYFAYGMIRPMSTVPGPLTKEIAGIIKGRMSRYNVGQTEMAKYVGVDQSQLSKMIRGMRHINIDQLEVMCTVLGVEIDKVMDEAALAVLNRGLWPNVPFLVVGGERVSSPKDDEPTPLSDAEEREGRPDDFGLAAKRGRAKKTWGNIAGVDD